MHTTRNRAVLSLCASLLFLGQLRAQSLAQFEKRVTEFTLPNGLHFILLERHDAPVVSFHTYVDAGSVDDPCDRTGLAHMFEHMAFKGTEAIGSKNYTDEKKAIEAVEHAYDQLDSERVKGAAADAERRRALERQLQAAMDQAAGFVDVNAYPRTIEENGGAGLNAETGEDSTSFFYSLPSNRIELWFLLESQRFFAPVFREFYKERDVVREERRMRVESNPEGKLSEMLLATAFAAHPYRQPTAGWASDIGNLRVADARAFFEMYYAPANITIAIAGDVDPAAARRLGEKYFGRLPARPLPAPRDTVEPKQEGEKRVAVETPSQPFLALAWKRPDQHDKDDPVFDVLGEILSSGRTGLLYEELVRDRNIALSATAISTFPGGKYPNLFLVWVAPSLGHTTGENEKAVYAILDGLKEKEVDPQTLARVKTKLRAALLRQLDNNPGMAEQLTFYSVNYGGWRKMFTALDDIDKITTADVRRVAAEYFVASGRTVAFTVAPKGGAQ
jgi:predicted Zn-dependent peptidase